MLVPFIVTVYFRLVVACIKVCRVLLHVVQVVLQPRHKDFFLSRDWVAKPFELGPKLSHEQLARVEPSCVQRLLGAMREEDMGISFFVRERALSLSHIACECRGGLGLRRELTYRSIKYSPPPLTLG